MNIHTHSLGKCEEPCHPVIKEREFYTVGTSGEETQEENACSGCLPRRRQHHTGRSAAQASLSGAFLVPVSGLSTVQPHSLVLVFLAQ